MSNDTTHIPLTKEERAQYRGWLQAALKGAAEYNGSEQAYESLLQHLVAIEAFIKAKNKGQSSPQLERAYAESVLPPGFEAPLTVNGVIDAANETYATKLRDAGGFEDILRLIQQGGGVFKRTDATFVQTDEGQLNQAASLTPKSMELKTQPRLAMVIQRLAAEGIYTDDIVAYVCKPDPHMVRKLPYILLQIPRLDKEIVVCDQVGEITFVSNKILGPEVWAHSSKDELKARPEITAVELRSEQGWWEQIHTILSNQNAVEKPKKVDVKAFAERKPPLDVALIKQCIHAHYLHHGEMQKANPDKEINQWPTRNSGDVQHGPYAGLETWSGIHSALRQGARGLPGGSSIPALNEEVSAELKLDYVNIQKQENLNIEKIKECIVDHYLATGKWPAQNTSDVQYGPYAHKFTWKGLDRSLHLGVRGLPGGSSIAALKEEVSAELKLDYANIQKREHLNIDEIKGCILDHYLATGEWPEVKTGDVKHGFYADKENWATINIALYEGGRGLAGGSSLAQVKEEVSKELKLDYVNIKNQEPLNMDRIRECILDHYIATEKWPTENSGKVQHGFYAGKETWRGIRAALSTGIRGLPGGSSLAILNEEVSEECGLDYVNNLTKEKLTIDAIKKCISDHHLGTGKWPTKDLGKVQYGPYAGKETWAGISLALSRGQRGLPIGSSLAELKRELSKAPVSNDVRGEAIPSLPASLNLTTSPDNYQGKIEGILPVVKKKDGRG